MKLEIEGVPFNEIEKHVIACDYCQGVIKSKPPDEKPHAFERHQRIWKFMSHAIKSLRRGPTAPTENQPLIEGASNE